jgi:hypothetical protein
MEEEMGSINRLLIGMVAAATMFCAGSAGAWLSDAPITTTLTGAEQVELSVDTHTGTTFASAIRFGTGNQVGWHRSTDDGTTWQPWWVAQWGTESAHTTASTVGYGRLLLVYQFLSSRQVSGSLLDATSGGFVGFHVLADETPLVARRLSVDSNDETNAATNFIACSVLENEATGQNFVKVYRSTDAGDSWGTPLLLDSGPTGQPGYIGDIAISNSVAGYPFYHIVYEKNGRPWVSHTLNAGATWTAPQELPIDIQPGSEVSVSGYGIRATFVGESPSHQVVCAASEDVGATWTAGVVIAGSQASARSVVTAQRSLTVNAVYRRSDGICVIRRSSTPAVPASWSPEEVVTLAPAGSPISISCHGADVGVGFINSADADRPYFSHLTGTLAGAGDEPVVSLADLEAPCVIPQPSRGPVAILVPRAGAATAASILDVAGRLVARLEGAAGPADGRRFEWNGLDLSGREVPRGRYYFRLQHAADGRGTPITLVR